MLSLLRGLAEAGVLVVVARVALALSDGDERLGLDLGPLGLKTLTISQALGAAAVAAVAMLLLHLVVAELSARMSSEALATARLRLSSAFLRSSWGLQATEREGHLQDVLTTYADQVMRAAALTTLILTAGFNLLALVATAIVVDVRAALAMVVGVAALAMLLRPLNGLTRRRAAGNRDNNNAFATTMTEVAGLAQEVTLFDVGVSIEDRLRSATERATHSQRQVTFLGSAVPGVYQSLAVVIVLAGLALVHTTGTGSVAELGAVVLLLIRGVSYGQQLQVGANALNQSAPYLTGDP